MKATPIDAPDAPAAAGDYAQAVAVDSASRLLFVSGQVPLDADDRLPTTFAEQCRLSWASVETQLRAAEMSFDRN